MNNILNFDKLKKKFLKMSKMSQYSKILIVIDNKNNAESCWTATYDDIGKCEFLYIFMLSKKVVFLDLDIEHSRSAMETDLIFF